MKNKIGPGSMFVALIVVALLVLGVGPFVGLFVYVDQKWGSAGIMFLGGLTVALPLIVFLKLVDMVGVAINQRIWANVSRDNADNQGNATVHTMKALLGLVKHIEKQGKGQPLPTGNDFDEFFAGIDGQSLPGPMPQPPSNQISGGAADPWRVDTSSPADVSNDLRIE